MIVEFAGLPGSGKTTLSRAVKEELLSRKKYITIREPTALIAEKKSIQRILIKLTYAILGFIGHPIINFRFFLIVIYSHQDSIKSFFKNLFNGIFLIGLYGWCKFSKQIVLFDQGGVQALWSVFYSCTVNNEKKQKLAARAPDFIMSQYIIFLETSNEIIISRLKKRSGMQSRLEENIRPQTIMKDLCRNMELLRNESLSRTNSNHPGMTLTLDNSGEDFLIKDSKVIAEKLLRIYGKN